MGECIEKCYICLENLDGVPGNLKCGCFNRYHTNCLQTWLLIQNECPICKKKMNENKNNNRDDDNDFELELDDNDIFYNPLVYFISIFHIYIYYIFYRIILD